jgi:membrane protein
MRLPIRHLVGAYDLVRLAIKDYSLDNGSLIAASVSYYVCLSIVPLGVLCVAIATFFLGSVEQARAALLRLVSEYYPVAGHSGAAVRAIVDEIVRGRAAATGLSSVLLLWSGMKLMNSVSGAVNVAWNVTVRRSFLAQKLVDFGLLVATLALLGLSLGMTASIELARELNIRFLGLAAADVPLFWSVLSYLVPLAVTTLAFALVYKMAPNAPVPFRVALVGAVFAGLMWEAAKLGFSLYVAHAVARASIYGSLAGLILIPVWINYSSAVSILGAEVASGWQKQQREKHAD